MRRYVLKKSLRFFRRNRKIKALLFGVLLALIALSISNKIFGDLNNAGEEPGQNEKWCCEEIIKDSHLGWKAPPSTVISHKKTMPEKVVFDAKYTFDSYSRRSTPRPANEAKHHALFFGGSFTLGEGVNDNETLPARVAEMLPEYNVYNYGFCAYGPNNALARMELIENGEEVPERGGFLVYIFIDHHIDRAIGRMSVVSTWAMRFPYYDLDPDHNIIRKGDFTSGRPNPTLLYRIFGPILTHYYRDLPESIEPKHLELTSKMILKTFSLAKQKLGTQHFVLLLYPGTGYKGITRNFGHKGITILNYSDLFDFKATGYCLEPDWHPSPKAYRIVANKLIADLVIENVVPSSALLKVPVGAQ